MATTKPKQLPHTGSCADIERVLLQTVEKLREKEAEVKRVAESGDANVRRLEGTLREAIRSREAALDTLKAEVVRLREALKKYGHHVTQRFRGRWGDCDKHPCRCGFVAALAKKAGE